jgi:uncharacterized protein YndB with AHSA1/START domain
MMSDASFSAEPEVDRELVISRIFDAPASLLFEAHSKPEYVSRWFGPKGWPLTLCEMDFRVGGRFRFAMTGPDGNQQQPFGGTYLEITPNEKIVYDNGFEAPGAEKMIITVTFDEKGNETKLTIHTLFASVAMKQQHVGYGYEFGVGSGLDQLGEVISEMRSQELGR